jgi:hypothetical protein
VLGTGLAQSAPMPEEWLCPLILNRYRVLFWSGGTHNFHAGTRHNLRKNRLAINCRKNNINVDIFKESRYL